VLEKDWASSLILLLGLYYAFAGVRYVEMDAVSVLCIPWNSTLVPDLLLDRGASPLIAVRDRLVIRSLSRPRRDAGHVPFLYINSIKYRRI